MSKQTLLAIDQGTTSSRAILFSSEGEIISLAQKELKLYYPHKGWVEQDPKDLWNDTLWACKKAIKEGGDGAANIAGIGITNQRETTIIWDRATGEPVYNAIVWQDRRSADFCNALKVAGHESMITSKTGLLLDPYFSASKINWIMGNIEGVRERANKGDLAFGTVDSWILWNLTGGPNGGVHATDATNASRTMLFDITQNEWSEELLELFGVPESLLPEVRDNAADFGSTSEELLGRSYVIGGMVGDQQAALIGQGCLERGMVKSTYGTGCFALMNIGGEFKVSKNRLLTTVAYRLDGQSIYALEGAIFMAGAAIQWLRDNLELFENAAQSEVLATSVEDNNGVYFVPAFTGLGAPHWEPEAKALIMGLSRESTGAHITRAALEAQGYQTLDLMDAMKSDSGVEIAVIRADGGLVANEFMCQFLADMLETPIELPKVTESTAWGAAVLAGVQAGVFNSLEDAAQHWSANKRYEPLMDDEERRALYEGWKTALKMLL